MPERVGTCTSVTKYVSTGQAAKELGVSHRSLLKWVETGELEPDMRTPGGHYRWDVERVRGQLAHRARPDLDG